MIRFAPWNFKLALRSLIVENPKQISLNDHKSFFPASFKQFIYPNTVKLKYLKQLHNFHLNFQILNIDNLIIEKFNLHFRQLCNFRLVHPFYHLQIQNSSIA